MKLRITQLFDYENITVGSIDFLADWFIEERLHADKFIHLHDMNGLRSHFYSNKKFVTKTPATKDVLKIDDIEFM